MHGRSFHDSALICCLPLNHGKFLSVLLDIGKTATSSEYPGKRISMRDSK